MRSSACPRTSSAPSEKKLIEEYSRSGDVNIVHLIYQKKSYEGHVQDYEFSGASMRDHWQSGYADTLAHPAPSRMAEALLDPSRHRGA